MTEAAEMLVADASIDVGASMLLGVLLGDWESLDRSNERLLHVLAGALGARSGAADELELFEVTA